MKKILEDVSFYTTNVCNLTCENCATYNNYKLKGHFAFDYETHKKWSKLVDIENIYIHGGEPFTNPNIKDWVLGIRELWPHSVVRVTTNGTLLSQHRDLVKLFLEHNVTIEIAVHDPKLWNTIKDEIESHLKDKPFKLVEEDNSYPRPGLEDYRNYFLYYMSPMNLDYFIMEQAYEFMPSSIRHIGPVIFMHRSDPVKAHDNCTSKKCHYMVNGRLYKCKTTAMSDILHRQYAVNDECQDILNRSASVGCDDNVNDFIDQLSNFIEQCTLCPEAPTESMIKIYPLNPKKPSLPRTV